MDLSICITIFNVKDFARECLRSVFNNQPYCDFEVIVVDDGSSDGSARMVEQEFPQVRLIRNQTNLGFSKANNQAIKISKGRYILLLNSDTVVPPGSFGKMVEFMNSRPEAGAVGPKMVYADGTPQPSVDFSPNLLTEFFHLFQVKKLLPTTLLRKRVGSGAGRFLGRTVRTYLQVYDGASNPVEVDCASGGCLMVRRDAIDKIGLLDEGFFIFMEDMDWCLRMKQAGFKTYFLPQITIVHHVGKSGQVDREAREKAFLELYRSRLYFFKKHRGVFARLILRVMMILSFSLRWLLLAVLRPLSKKRDEVRARQKMYGEVVKVALK